jgi:hypothetical protein
MAALCGSVGLLFASAAPALALDVLRVEAIGAVPLRTGAPPSASVRDEAVRQALQDAVQRAAAELLASGSEDAQELQEALGSDPFEFATAFQILEDRGERAALFNADPDVESEYVVVVDAQIDRDRIRDRLLAAGMVVASAPTGIAIEAKTRIVLEGLDDYRVYQRIRAALVDAVGVRSANPVEASAGLIVLEVDSDRSADGLLAGLRAATPDLMLVPVQIDRDLLRLRVKTGAAAPNRSAPGAATD